MTSAADYRRQGFQGGSKRRPFRRLLLPALWICRSIMKGWRLRRHYGLRRYDSCRFANLHGRPCPLFPVIYKVSPAASVLCAAKETLQMLKILDDITRKRKRGAYRPAAGAGKSDSGRFAVRFRRNSPESRSYHHQVFQGRIRSAHQGKTLPGAGLQEPD